MMLMTSHLVVPVVDNSDAGEYTCIAISDHDQSKTTIAHIQGGVIIAMLKIYLCYAVIAIMYYLAHK